MDAVLQTSKFESDFIERTYSTVVTDMSIAFSELVANAWDAGANQVRITIPDQIGGEIVIEDNGSGMTDEEFQNRWMVIAYNRVAHQGNFVDYGLNKTKEKRLAYGRNGIGRHAMLCFNDSYIIETWKDGNCNKYEIIIDGGESAFSVREHTSFPCVGNGTRLIVKAIKRLPQYSDIKSTLGYRFLFDPEFEILVNNTPIIYQQTLSPKDETIIKTKYGSFSVKIYNIPDGEKSTSINGIAFWSGKRLVGNPSWIIDSYRVEDARKKFALRHLVIVQADHLINDVTYDWSNYKKTEPVVSVYNEVINYIKKYRSEYYRSKTSDVRNDVIKSNLDQIESLSLPARQELKEFFDCYLDQKPEIETDELNTIISALIHVLNARNGYSLLSKLSQMEIKEIDELDKILDEWSIFDVKKVLDEIDSRLKVIDAIQKLSSEKSTDELHVLHPLITQARWLFGIEFDNSNYTFNRTLSTVVQNFLNSARNEKTTINWSKRPDLVIGADFSLGATCVEDYDNNEISVVKKVLIIELKKGGFTIRRGEINQAEEYVDDLYKGNKLNSRPKIKAFVIGDSIDPSISTSKTQEDYGEVHAYTYSQLVNTAEKRLFNLKDKLNKHYSEIQGEDYLKSILSEPKQMQLAINH